MESTALDPAVGITIVVSTLVVLLFIGLVVLLMIVSRNRRNRHRAELAEVRVRHAEEVRKVEREVMEQTITEVGRDLHDNIGQLLTVTRMGVNSLLATASDPVRTNEVKQNLDGAITEVRRLSRTLNADRWLALSLGQVIAEECARVQRTGAVQVNFTESGHEALVTADQKLVLFRLFQEAMNNALKHAQASVITVRLSDGDGVHLEVNDDGTGFDVAANPGILGQGLLNMDRRAALIGYHCKVVSRLGAGTTVTICPA